jgi:DNA-binding SARP family transcriptional activator
MGKNASNRMRQPGADESSASEHNWQEALAALHARDYERLSDSLRAFGTTSNIGDQTDLIKIALQVCLACIHCRSEIEWHRQARREAHEHERELRQGLETILAGIINATGALELGGGQESPSSLTLPTSRENSAPAISQSPGIWERIRALLTYLPGQASNAAHENPVPSFEAEHPVRPQREAEEELDRSTAAIEPIGIDEAHIVEDGLPLLVVYCLGSFRLYQDERPIREWPSGKGKSIFKYLLTHRERPVAKEILMDLFWPDTDPDSARNNLNVAIYGMRQALRNDGRGFSHVIFRNDSYLFNPRLNFWVDYESFVRRVQTAQSMERQGELAKAIHAYTSAEVLYQGEFLEEDRYEDWLIPQRQRLQAEYLNLLDRLSHHHYEHNDLTNCAHLCLKMLAIDACREEAHRRLMRCYYHQGQPYLALRQYHLCFESLNAELDIVPSASTTELYERIRRQNGG